ncbi:protein kinase [Achlya hypogyna]|uniref:Protein kinase n=1 Tax=Achlya hypogyna TaxID=1202772 RepID=A0A1V9ZPK4_ACHHY|nr:protein kinase [Achlya hypogyna]
MECAYIVGFVGVAWEDPVDVLCVVEYMNLGDLGSYLATHSPDQFSWPQKLQCIYSIVRGLVYLHTCSPPIIHRDLKSRNVLLDSEKGTKLGDFHSSREMDEATLTRGVGSFQWVAPECIVGQPSGSAGDIFALGVLLSEFSTHTVPYAGVVDTSSQRPLSALAIVHLVASGKLRPTFDTTHTPQWVHDMAAQCLALDPADRPTSLALMARSHLMRFGVFALALPTVLGACPYTSINAAWILVADDHCPTTDVCGVDANCSVVHRSIATPLPFVNVPAVGNLHRFPLSTLVIADTMRLDLTALQLPASVVSLKLRNISHLDMTPLSTVTLATLSVESSEVVTLPSFDRLPNLTSVVLDGNPLAAISNVSLGPSLALFSCNDCALTNLVLTARSFSVLDALPACTVNATSGQCFAADVAANIDMCSALDGTIRLVSPGATIHKIHVCVLSGVAVVIGAIVGAIAVVAAILLCAHREKPTRGSKARSLSADAYPVLETPHLKHYPGTISVSSLGPSNKASRSIRTSWGPSISDETVHVKPIRMFRLELADLHVTSTTPLASGTYGEIWFGRYDRQPVVIKRLKNKSADRVQLFVEEMQLLSRMDSPYIIRFIGVSWELPIDMEGVVEFMDMGDLRTHLSVTTPATFSWPAKQSSAVAIARGLAYLHTFETPVIHRDLKSRNVLLDSIKGTKLTDFGEPRDTTPVTTATAYQWTAPEVLRGLPCTAASDIYAYGVILSELSTHCVPYTDSKSQGNAALLAKIAQGKAKPAFDKPHTPAWVLDIAHICLATDPAQRPTATALMATEHGAKYYDGLAVNTNTHISNVRANAITSLSRITLSSVTSLSFGLNPLTSISLVNLSPDLVYL